MLDSFQQSHIFTGFQWTGTLPMNNALLNNSASGHGYSQVNAGSRIYPQQMINMPTWWDRAGYGVGIWASPFMQYEPTLELDTNNLGTIVQRPGDPSNPVFGFLYRKGTILFNQSDSNYSRLILYKNDLPNYGSDSIVLKNIWPQPHFKTEDSAQFYGEGQSDHYYGKKWYLTINLRRLHPDTDTIVDDSTVLSIKMPFNGINISGNIKFDSIPYESMDSIEHLNFYEDRGYLIKLHHLGLSDSLKITNRMLPTQKSYSNITISAEFNTSNHNINNYQFGFDTAKISNLDIIVKYFGKLDIAIDYIRVESINAKLLLTGVLDSLSNDPSNPNLRGFITIYTDPDNPANYEQPDGIKEIIQSCLDSMKAKTHTWQDGNIFRFYSQDVESEKFYWWGQLRYFNLITNGMAITRDVPQYTNLYEYYTKSPNRYLGTTFCDYEGIISAPYFRSGSDGNPLYLDLKFGWLGHPFNATPPYQFGDTLISHYETFIYRQFDSYYFNAAHDTTTDLSLYQEALNMNQGSLLLTWGKYLNSKYTNFSNTKNFQYLYSDKPWYYNTWFSAIVNAINIAPGYTSTNKYAVIGTLRPKTGEETRLLYWNGLIMGCKGFYHDRELAGSIPSANCMGFGYGPAIDSSQNIFFDNDKVGSDFINSINDNWNIKPYVNVDTTAKKLGLWNYINGNLSVDNSRIYIGNRSTRCEIARIQQWIRANDDTLMNLKLCAWYGKGLHLFQHQDTAKYGSSPILSNFIRTTRDTLHDSINVRRIFDPRYGTWNNPPESWDSTFLDISLFRHSSDTCMKNLFFLAIQNRRSDPLIYDTTHTIPYVRFLSTSEFQDSCIKNTDSLKFQNYWWQKFACRLLTLPFNVGNTPNSFSGYILHIQELGSYNKWLDSVQYPWRTSKYYHKIDTTITEDMSLKIKLLPSEGKFLKVNVSSLFIPDGDTNQTNNPPCYNCDTLNNPSNFQVTFAPQPQNCNNCCWDIMLHNSTNCSYTNLPVMLNLWGGFFGSTNFSPGDFGYFDSTYALDHIYFVTGNLDSFTTKKFGTICVPHGSNYSCELTIGKKVDGQWFKCGRTIDYDLTCIKTASCDSIRIILKAIPDTSTIKLPGPQVCCWQVFFLSNDSGYSCIRKIKLYQTTSTDTTLIYENLNAGMFNFLDTTNNSVDTVCITGTPMNPGLLHLLAKFYNENDSLLCQQIANAICSGMNPHHILPRESGNSIPDSNDNKKPKSVKNPGDIIKELSVKPNPTDNTSIITYELN
ncbi:MAG: hypothetical protein ABSG15_13110, partial [FCB group bacterium]